MIHYLLLLEITKNQSMTDRVNEQLDVAQRIYADTNPMLSYISKSDTCSF